MLVTWAFSSPAAVMAVIEIGVSCRFSDRRRAVTTISSTVVVTVSGSSVLLAVSWAAACSTQTQAKHIAKDAFAAFLA